MKYQSYPSHWLYEDTCTDTFPECEWKNLLVLDLGVKYNSIKTSYVINILLYIYRSQYYTLKMLYMKECGFFDQK